jgi:hypothetical protein
MNKTLLKIGMVVVLSMMAANAFANAEVTATVIGGGSFAPSNKVKIFCDSSTTSYLTNSAHLQGDRIMAGSSTSPAISYSTKATGTDITTATTPTSSWSSL